MANGSTAFPPGKNSGQILHTYLSHVWCHMLSSCLCLWLRLPHQHTEILWFLSMSGLPFYLVVLTHKCERWLLLEVHYQWHWQNIWDVTSKTIYSCIHKWNDLIFRDKCDRFRLVDFAPPKMYCVIVCVVQHKKNFSMKRHCCWKNILPVRPNWVVAFAVDLRGCGRGSAENDWGT